MSKNKNNTKQNAIECENLYNKLKEIVDKLESSEDGQLSLIVDSVSEGLEIQKKLKERFQDLKQALEKDIEV
ncbi:TPA: hypothetical protein NV714_003260 [Escherichia coli]|jgi:exonuclease VII small subunit|nr:hypothetical protein [Escherichia coli]